MTAVSKCAMHRDHLLWLGESQLWQDNLRLWQSELEQVLEQFVDARDLLEQHAQRLQAHAAAVQSKEQAIRKEEHDVAAFEKGFDDPGAIFLAAQHQSEALARQAQRAAHQELIRDHYAILSHWKAFLRELRNSASQAPVPPAKSYAEM